ncbi:hypothetical protein OH799_05230 [Nocardia sp. NBC_00881]|uniref:hypothetical protein n=1 Tax=Nocardia sp. NBC_00881 TaxID=2975995 RepID=UPI00386834CE|nr:hypothetical protein OH799_05230 [Nocardia sp. NBC_00881]
MNGQPQLLPAGPGPVFDVKVILNGTVDMRTYQRKYLVVYSQPQGELLLGELIQADPRGTLSALTSCIEWLDEHFGWEPVNIFTRQGEHWYIHYAMLRRRE